MTVAPIVPDAQKNLGATLALQAIGQGLQASAQFARMRRESEMDILKLAEHERLAEEGMELEKQKMSQDFDIRQATLDSTRTLNEAHAAYYTAGAEAYATGTKTAAQRAIAFNQQRQALVDDVNGQASRLQLDDPNFATKNPVQFAANVMQFEDMFSLSPLPEVKNAISVYRRTADQQKIPIRMGATHDPVADKWEGGQTKTVPIWQVVKNLQDPDTQEETMNALMASGHTRIVEEFQDFSGVKVPVKKTELKPQIKSYLEKGKDVKFERVPSRVAPAMLPKSAAGGTAPTELPVDIPEDTTTDPQASLRQRLGTREIGGEGYDPSATPSPTPFKPYDMFKSMGPDNAFGPNVSGKTVHSQEEADEWFKRGYRRAGEPQASAKQPQFNPTETDTLIAQAKGAIAKGAPMAAVAQKLQEFGIDPSQLWAA